MMKVRIIILFLVAALSGAVAIAVGCSRVEGKTESGKPETATTTAKKGEGKLECKGEQKKEEKLFEPAPLGFSTVCQVSTKSPVPRKPPELKEPREWKYVAVLDIYSNPFDPFYQPPPPEYLAGGTAEVDPYDLTQMRLVGVVLGPTEDQNRAYIVFPNGQKKTVGINDRLGKQGGKVIEIGFTETGRSLGMGELTAKETVGYVVVEEVKMNPGKKPEDKDYYFKLQRELRAEPGPLYKTR